MANSVYQSLTFTASDDADETTILGRITSVNTAGRSVSYYDKKTFTLAPSAGPISIMPSGTPTLANGSLQVFVKLSYDASGSKRVTFNPDAVGACDARDFIAVGIDTSITITNPDATYSVTVEVFAYVLS